MKKPILILLLNIIFLQSSTSNSSNAIASCLLISAIMTSYTVLPLRNNNSLENNSSSKHNKRLLRHKNTSKNSILETKNGYTSKQIIPNPLVSCHMDSRVKLIDDPKFNNHPAYVDKIHKTYLVNGIGYRMVGRTIKPRDLNKPKGMIFQFKKCFESEWSGDYVVHAYNNNKNRKRLNAIKCTAVCDNVNYKAKGYARDNLDKNCKNKVARFINENNSSAIACENLYDKPNNNLVLNGIPFELKNANKPQDNEPPWFLKNNADPTSTCVEIHLQSHSKDYKGKWFKNKDALIKKAILNCFDTTGNIVKN